MFWAQDSSGQLIEPRPGVAAICPLCGDRVIPKCGDHVAWHFAHESRVDCDPWAESEGPWHRWWKTQLPAHQREVVLGPHRADMFTRGRVIELQHASINTEEALARERFYGDLIWLYDLTDYDVVWDGEDEVDDDERSAPRLFLWKRRDDWTFYWRHPKISVVAARKPVFLDLDGWLFQIASMQVPERNRDLERVDPLRGSRSGWGVLWTPERFSNTFFIPESREDVARAIGRSKRFARKPPAEPVQTSLL